MTAGLLILHHRRPDAIRIEVLSRIIEEGLGRRLEDARREALPDQATLAVAAIRVEPVAHHSAAIPNHVGDDGDERQGHLGEVYVGVGNR